MKNQQTYAVVDTDTGTLIGSELTYEEKNQCLFLHGDTHLTVFKEAPSLEMFFYTKAADAYSDAAEAYADHDKEAEAAFVEESRLWNKIAYDYELATQKQDPYGQGSHHGDYASNTPILQDDNGEYSS